jgi:amidohydrolase
MSNENADNRDLAAAHSAATVLTAAVGRSPGTAAVGRTPGAETVAIVPAATVAAPTVGSRTATRTAGAPRTRVPTARTSDRGSVDAQDPGDADAANPGDATSAAHRRIRIVLARREGELIAMRRYLHSHPELSGQEFATTALVAARLRRMGLETRLIPSGNGVLADIGRGERAIALRADLDALAVTDPKDVPYRSTVDGACHACGHDVHTSCLLGAAYALSDLDRRGLLPGRVRLMFQPSEERFPSGAPLMIAAGGLDGVDAVFGLHCNPQFDAGTVAVRSGAFTAAADEVEIRLTGPGGHSARPHLTVDLVHALGRLVADVPALVRRRADGRTRVDGPSKVTMVFGRIAAGGAAANAIPSEGSACAVVRCLDETIWELLPELVDRAVTVALKGTGAQAVVGYTRGVPPVINDPVATAVVAATAGRLLGEEQVRQAEVSMGAEDFAFYLREIPGAMFRLGVRPPGATDVVDIHHPRFDVDESAIGVGARMLAGVALAAMAEPGLRR